MKSINAFKLTTSSLAALVLFVSSASAATITVVNGGFDITNPSPNVAVALTNSASGNFYSDYFKPGVTFGMSDASGPTAGDLLGWSSSQPSNIFRTGVALQGTDYVNLGSSTGTYAYVSGVDGLNTFSQTLGDTLLANATYTLTVALATNGGSAPDFRVDLFAGSTQLTLDSGTATPALGNTFTDYTFSYTTGGAPVGFGETLKIQFSNSNGNQALLDNVSLSVVPEPGAVGLLTAGLCFSFFGRRRGR